MPTIKRFEDLDIWQAARLLVSEIYRLTHEAAFSKDFILRDHIRKSAISIPSNIAEGFERDGNREFIQFLSNAKGSTGELISQLCIAMDQSYITKDQFAASGKSAKEMAKKIGSLIEYLKKSNMTGIKFKP